MHEVVLKRVLALVVRATDGGDGRLVDGGGGGLVVGGVGHGVCKLVAVDVAVAAAVAAAAFVVAGGERNEAVVAFAVAVLESVG